MTCRPENKILCCLSWNWKFGSLYEIFTLYSRLPCELVAASIVGPFGEATLGRLSVCHWKLSLWLKYVQLMFLCLAMMKFCGWSLIHTTVICCKQVIWLKAVLLWLNCLPYYNACAAVIVVDALAFPFVGLVSGDVIEVAVVSIQGPDDIICQPVSSIVQLSDLMASLQTSCHGKRSPAV